MFIEITPGQFVNTEQIIRIRKVREGKYIINFRDQDWMEIDEVDYIKIVKSLCK